MDENTEALAESILNGCVPANWMSKSYASSKSLANYVIDFKSRVEFWQVKNCIYFFGEQNDRMRSANCDLSIKQIQKYFCSIDVATAEPNASAGMDIGIFFTASVFGRSSVELFT